MPDLMTHIFVAQGCRKAARGGLLTPWFLIGTVLPDVLTRPFNIILPSLFWFFMPLHTPVGLFFVCALISHFFPAPNKRPVFCNLLAGALLHLFLDLLQKHMADGYYMFFPFSWQSFEFGLIWPETTLYLLPIWIGACILFGVRTLARQRAQKLARAQDMVRAGSYENGLSET